MPTHGELEKFELRYLEFGVYKGETINFIARHINGAKVHGFDSFQGLPEHWGERFSAGAFDLKGHLPPVRDNVSLHAGWFDETLPEFAETHPQTIAFMHIDCALYSSTKCVFEALGDRLKAGSVVVFDEYFNYPGWQQGEYKAFREFLEAKSVSFKYFGYNPTGEQVAIVIR